MKTAEQDSLARLAQRVAELEKRLIQSTEGSFPTVTHDYNIPTAIPFLLGAAALGCGYLGVGLPFHYYQFLFAALTLLLAYHRSWLRFSPGPWRWPQLVLNYMLLCLFFKLLIGGGMSYPFDWLKVPALERSTAGEGASWLDKVMPNYELVWRDVTSITSWGVDITRIQTLFLIATLMGALMRFQPFASITALVLLIVSIPTFLGFNWDGVVLFLIAGGTAFYLQTAPNPRVV